jgi:iron complex outermembrane recepter protein
MPITALSTGISDAIHRFGTRPYTLAVAVSAALACAGASAQDVGPRSEEEVIVTATRRAESVQDVPLNITALGGDTIQEQGIADLVDVARSVPGLYVIDQGARAANQIIVRGLNANTISGTEALGNAGGGTVATYVGEVPLYIDLKPDDMERVEVLMGPQGTLYGAGTLGGAIRYIPKRPQFDATEVQVRGRGYGLAESDGFGREIGATLNLPIAERLAFRATVGYLDDPGFVDYDYLVREPGVSDPEPDFSNPSDVGANLRRHKDADDEQTLSGRAALRYKPVDGLDINLTYYFQDQDVGGRSVDHHVSFGTDKYVAAHRYLEPSDRRNELLALELTADLGFAELTSASGASRYREKGGRDQTDLLITLEYSYEAFPSFSAFTRERQKDQTFNQELRLVSKTEGPLSWIAGAFFNRLYNRAESKEFTPLYSEFLLTLDPTLGYRPDNFEFISVDKKDQTEQALYGELSYQITDRWQVAAGARWYEYDLKTKNAATVPLFNTVFQGAPADEVGLEFEPGGQKDNGRLFKFNTSYDINDDVMVYATLSEGFRMGNSNGVAACEDPNATGQLPCGLPDELAYSPDKTKNYELGLRSEWFQGRVILNGSIYYIDWKDPQLASTTDNGGLPITRNGKGAQSRGLELYSAAQITGQLLIRASYAYIDAELTDDAPSLLNTFVPPGFNGTRIDVDGQDGDRLPGSPKQQGNVWLNYELPLSTGFKLDLDYGIAAQSDILTKSGKRAGGESLGGFAVHYASATLHADAWTFGLYARNLFNKYAVTGVRSTRASIQTVQDIDGNAVRVRSYYNDLLRPREIGLRFTYDFEL